MAYIGKTPTIGNFQVCDAISVVNGQAAYTMQVGGVNVSPESANHMLVSLNGILQRSGSSFTVSGSTITFASNLVTGDVIDFIQILGNVLDLGVPSDNTVSLAKLTATGTKDATTFLRGDNSFQEVPAGGITEADQWRLTSRLTDPNNADIVANLERVDDASFSKIGTGMTESSGLFTFPTTGVYRIQVVSLIYVPQSDGGAGVMTNISSNGGSSWDYVAETNGGNATGSQTYMTVTSECFVNVTNATNFRCKFSASSMAAARLEGQTAYNMTSFSFIRLGDSQ